jgi:hypothetical protein
LSYNNPPKFSKTNNIILNDFLKNKEIGYDIKIPTSFENEILTGSLDIYSDIFVSLEHVGISLFKKYESLFEKYYGLKNKSFMFCFFDYCSFKWTELLYDDPLLNLINFYEGDKKRSFFVHKAKKYCDTGKKPFFFLWIGKKIFYERVESAYEKYLNNSQKAAEDFIFNMIKMGKIEYSDK